MDQDKEFLGKEPIGKLLLKLALPTVAAQLINMLYNIVDRIYIGHIPEIGADALTGVGVCMPLIMMVSAFAALVGQLPWGKKITIWQKRFWAIALQHRFSFLLC